MLCLLKRDERRMGDLALEQDWNVCSIETLTRRCSFGCAEGGYA
jgi:hypothetical protein